MRLLWLKFKSWLYGIGGSGSAFVKVAQHDLALMEACGKIIALDAAAAVAQDALDGLEIEAARVHDALDAIEARRKLIMERL